MSLRRARLPLRLISHGSFRMRYSVRYSVRYSARHSERTSRGPRAGLARARLG